MPNDVDISFLILVFKIRLLYTVRVLLAKTSSGQNLNYSLNSEMIKYFVVRVCMISCATPALYQQQRPGREARGEEEARGGEEESGGGNSSVESEPR